MEWVEYIVGHLQTRTDPEAEDLISLLIHTDGDPLSTEDLIYETMLILVGGDETTRHVMSGGLEALLLHPRPVRGRVAGRPERCSPTPSRRCCAGSPRSAT